MRLTLGHAKVVSRLCRITGVACAIGVILLLLGKHDGSAPPQVVGFSQQGARVEPLSYKLFVQLYSSMEAPFSFQDMSLEPRSFVVEEPEPIEQEVSEVNIEGLSLLAIVRGRGALYAVLYDGDANELLKVYIGDMVRDCKVIEITRDTVVLLKDDETRKITWDRPWRRITGDDS